jgi:hypothetical protein
MAKKANKAAQADALKTQRRVDDVLRIRLDGAEWWDVVAFVRGKQADEASPWYVPPDGKPLCESMIRIYQRRADELILSAHEKSRRKLFRRHLAQRRHLYAKAATSGDLRSALACLQDEAKMLGLYPAEKTRHAGPDGASAPRFEFIEVPADAADRGGEARR